MAKARPFSIFLLKPDRDESNSLKDGHGLVPANAPNISDGAKLYILDSAPTPPWWRGYFGIKEDLKQEHKGALLFLKVKDRCFALSFGMVFHHLDDTAYEYDFGLRVTLNSVDPKELKSADMVEPGAARRKRTQVPISTELTYLDFDGNSEIIKSLTGKVKSQYKELFQNATGSASLKVGLKLEPNQLQELCAKLLALYNSEDYKAAFPNIQNIAPVKDPEKIDELDGFLIESLRNRDSRVVLTIPDIVDYRDNTCCVFSGNGQQSDILPDITIDELYKFLGEDFDFSALTLEKLRAYRMMLTDADGRVAKSYNIYRALIFDAEPDGEQAIYHICEGNWYKVEKSYVERLKGYLDKKCAETDLCPYDHDAKTADGKSVYSEEKYNAEIPVWDNRFICLDQTDISPAGNTQIEPCDIYSVEDDAATKHGCRAKFYHLKISTRSSQLSHLFNQGVNSVELLQLEEEAREKLKKLLTERMGPNDEKRYLAPLDSFDFKVIFGVITHKGEAEKSENLPLFSRISLMRNMQYLDLMKIPSQLTFIDDKSPKKEGFPEHPQIIVEAFVLPSGKVEIRPLPNQGFDETKPIKFCPKALTESTAGSKFKLRVKKNDDGDLSTYHGWPWEAIDVALAAGDA